MIVDFLQHVPCAVAGIENRSIDTYSSIGRTSGEDRNQTEPWKKLSDSMEGMISGFNESDIYKILRDDGSTLDAFPVGTLQTYVGLASGLLTVILLFLTCTALLIKQRGRNKVALLQKHTVLLCDSSSTGIVVNSKDVNLRSSIVNGLSLIRKPIVITMTTSDTSVTPVTSTASTVNSTSSPNTAVATIGNIFVETDSAKGAATDHLDRPVINARHEQTCRTLPEENFILAETNHASAHTTDSYGESI